MADREHLELLASRFLDGDLSPAEHAELQAALAHDTELRELLASLQRVHNSINLLSEQRLPSDFTSRVLEQAFEPAAVIQLPVSGWRHWAAAASVILMIGLLVGAAVLNNGGKPEGAPEIAFDKPASGGTLTPPDVTPRHSSASVVAFSEGELELASPKGVQRTSRFEGSVTLPAEVKAPAGTHAVLELQGGTAVLSPGASARLTDADLDGIPDIEPMEGDLYIESAGPGVRSRVGSVDLNVDGGLTLRRTADGYMAEPSHGGAKAGETAFGFRQCALISDGNVKLSNCERPGLDDWAVRGRADAIKLQVRRLLGDKFDRIPADHWKQWDKFLRGVLSQPWQAATYAYTIRFVLKYDFFEGASPEELKAWGTIAGIMAEGTSEADIPLQVLEVFRAAEQEFDRDPESLAQFKQMIREWIERNAEHR
ncbi:MAG: hypothetical protein H6841_02450 [Planctomycetes bacterium]|nr:hypothetical protein [Planctomycetota bacterium]MCB9936554.1 hypothetical protein [Planctomycetota bacterium]